MRIFLFFFTLFIFNQSSAQQSYNMTLLGQLSYEVGANDVWGYVDHQGNEYAIVGLVNGTSFVDVTNPSIPVEKALIPGPTCVWRDIKTWNNYAYVVHDGVEFSESQGLMIVDLSDLNTGNVTYSNFYFDDQFNNAHNIYIDEKGVVYLFGGNYATGGALMFDVSIDPLNPEYLGEFQDYYLHDGMVRGDTLWGAAIWEGVVAAIDVADKMNPQILGSALTPSTFTHNAWISDDGTKVFTTDEVQAGSIGSIDVTDVTNMAVIDDIQSWSAETNVIPHNTHVLGHYLVTSYYCDGVTVVDASDPYNLQEVAYYDTSDSTGGTYSGAWGAYPWLPSGNILVTDRQEGLHVLSIDNLDFSIDALNELLNIKVYPNPSADYFYIEFQSSNWNSAIVSSQEGKVLEEIKNTNDLSTIELGHELAKGVYLLCVENNEGVTSVYHLIKQ